jgi:hypothetical protein
MAVLEFTHHDGRYKSGRTPKPFIGGGDGRLNNSFQTRLEFSFDWINLEN